MFGSTSMDNDKYYVPFFKVKVNGSLISLDVSKKVKQVVVTDHLEKADMVQLSVDNHDMDMFDIYAELFGEGSELSVTIGYHNGEENEFFGEITRLTTNFPANGAPTMSVTAYDMLHRLAREKKPETFNNMTDSAIVAKIAGKAKLKPVPMPTTDLRKSVQTNSKNWLEFIKELAKRNNFEVWAKQDQLHFGIRLDGIGTFHRFKYGESLISFQPTITTANQVNEVEVRGWDPSKKKAVVGKAKLTNISGSTSVSARGRSQITTGAGNNAKKVVNNPNVATKSEADTLAKAILKTQSDKLIEGTGKVIGSPGIKAGTYMMLSGLGIKFSGLYFVKESTHTLGTSGYTTDFKVRKEL